MPVLPTCKTVQSVRREVRAALAVVSETPDLDVDLLLSGVLGLDRVGLMLNDSRELSNAERKSLSAAVNRRLDGEPVAYILGHKAFRSIELVVDSRVLVPRPETEWMVDFALEWIGSHDLPARVLDLGTGSGAIALALASESEDVEGLDITGTDVSEDALHVARENRASLGLEHRVRFDRSDLFDALEGEFDLILANLPYLRDDQRHPSIASEPELALFAGTDGLDIYRRFLAQIEDRTTSRGVVVMEIDPEQRDTLMDMVAGMPGWVGSIEQDLSSLDRFLLLRRNAE